MMSRFRRQAGDFYYWYGLGLALIATGLTGVFLLTVQGGILGWTNRLTQYLGCAYLFVAAWTAARETGGWKISLAAVEEAWRKGELLPALRKEPLLWLALRYGSGGRDRGGGVGVAAGADGVGRPRIAPLHHVLSGGDGGGGAGRFRAGRAGDGLGERRSPRMGISRRSDSSPSPRPWTAWGW